MSRLEVDSISIAPCGKHEFSQILSLLAQLWPDKELHVGRLRAVFERGIASSTQYYIGARAEAGLIGFGSLTIKNNLWLEGNMANIDELVVDAEYRGRKIGTRLVGELVREARARGCSRIELDSAFHRQAAHHFYESLSFERRAYLFSKRL